MFLTLEKPNGMRLVLDVGRVCYLGQPVDVDLKLADFLSDAKVRSSSPEETMFFAAPSEAPQ